MTALAWYLVSCVCVSFVTFFMTVRNLRALRPPPEADPSDDALVSVCIPCRDEERNIDQVVRSVLASNHSMLEVLVYDDESTDRTGEILRTLAAEDPRVRIVPSVKLPQGWVGKQHACHRLAKAARGDRLLFIDHGDSWRGVDCPHDLLSPDRVPSLQKHAIKALTLGQRRMRAVHSR